MDIAPGREVPLSVRQGEIYREYVLEPDAPIHNIGGYYRVRGQLHMTHLASAVKKMAEVTDVMRLVLRRGTSTDLPVQCLDTLPDGRLACFSAPTEQDAFAWMRDYLSIPFQIFDSPLYRVGFVGTADGFQAVVIIFHHIVADGAAVDLMMNQLAHFYNYELGLVTDSKGIASFESIVDSESRYLANVAHDKDRHFWKSRFSDLPPKLLWPTDGEPLPCGAQAHVHELELSEGVQSRLARLASDGGSQLFYVLAAAIGAYFAHLTGAQDLVLAVSLLNRTTSAEKNAIGMAASIAPIRIRSDPGLTFEAHLKAVAADMRSAYRHHKYPISRINQDIGLYRSGRDSLFDITLSYLVSKLDGQTLGEAAFEPLRQLHHGFSSRPVQIFLDAMHPSKPVRISMILAARMFSRARADDIARGLVEFIDRIAHAPERPLHALTDGTASAGGTRKPRVLDSIDEVASGMGDALAVVGCGQSLTYRSLVDRSNQVANYLLANGLGPEEIVAVCADRSAEMIVAILGIWKAGGAYLPVDPRLPVARNQVMLLESAVRTVLFPCKRHPEIEAAMPVAARSVELADDAIRSAAAHAPNVPIASEQLAYVIYTSGSSGRPKGVLVTHAGLPSLALLFKNRFGLGPGARVLQFARFGFDASIWEIMMALTAGATLCMPAEHELMPGPSLATFMEEFQVSIATLPSSVLPLMRGFGLPSLKTLIVAGEACPPIVAGHWSRRCDFFNAYGPTEATVCATVGRFGGGVVVPIGVAIPDTQLFVLDASLHPVPRGAAGDLFLGGAGVARGYIGQPGLTAERFVANPFGRGDRLYRTGDRVRVLDDGQLEFIGRADWQIKRNGFRIELGEIEHVLLGYRYTQDGAVIATPGGEHEVAIDAYLTLEREHANGRATDLEDGALGVERDIQLVRQHLLAHLPDYMIPNRIVILERMPTTSNGKIDRAALQGLRAHPPGRVRLQEANGDVRTRISGIWSEVLGRPDIASNVNFFEAGGDSMRLARSLQLINSEFGLDLKFADLLRYSTVGALTQYIERRQAATAPPTGAPIQSATTHEKISRLLTRVAHNVIKR